MAVRITDLCISCDAFLDECPAGSIVDADDNPTGEDIYYFTRLTQIFSGALCLFIPHLFQLMSLSFENKPNQQT